MQAAAQNGLFRIDVGALLGVDEGDELIVSEAPNGEMRITRGEVDLDRQLEAARRGMKRYRNALRELAK